MATGTIQRPFPTAANVGAVSLTGLHSKFVVENKEASSVSISANSKASGTLSGVSKSGYTTLGCVGISYADAASGGNSKLCSCVVSAGGYYTICNHGSSAATVKLVATFLYVSNS